MKQEIIRLNKTKFLRKILEEGFKEQAALWPPRIEEILSKHTIKEEEPTEEECNLSLCREHEAMQCEKCLAESNSTKGVKGRV